MAGEAEFDPFRMNDCQSALLAGEGVRCDKQDTAFFRM
jgi:hypothetical protein